MQARMRGGLLNKARRGVLRVPLPMGFLYDPLGQVVLDPDQQVQQNIYFLFHSFRRLGSACAVVKAFREAKLLFPHRLRDDPGGGELVWEKLGLAQTLFVLHNPRYAGAFVYGRTRTRRTLEGSHHNQLPQEEWHTLLTGAHPGYIAWEEYQENQRRLRENSHALGPERRKSPPREGPALLQGLAVCGVCGGRMKVTNHVRAGRGRSVPDYVCEGRSVDDPQPGCQWIPGAYVDQAISERVGTFKDGLWSLDVDNTLTISAGDSFGVFGQAGDTPLLGDWSGDGKTKVGIYRGCATQSPPCYGGIFGLDYDGTLTFTGPDKGG